MAKKKQDEVKDQEESKSADLAATEVEAPAKAVGADRGLPGIGRILHFYRKQNTGNATKHETLAAMVIGYPPATSNYQAKDLAVKLKVMTEHGDHIKEAMFDSTGEKKEHRWGWPV